MKAFISTHTARLAQRTHLGVTGDGHSERCAESDEQHALAELAKILADTEAGTLPCKHVNLPLGLKGTLRVDLAALVADGGPLDELAWLSFVETPETFQWEAAGCYLHNAVVSA